MASASSMSVSLECVNVCKQWRWEGGGRYDCNLLSCAWKAPRVLTGFLASTAHPHQSSSMSRQRNGRRNRYNFECKAFSIVSSHPDGALDIILLEGFSKSILSQVASRRWQLRSSSAFSVDTANDVTPESLWEDLKPTISYLSPKELELVHNALMVSNLKNVFSERNLFKLVGFTSIKPKPCLGVGPLCNAQQICYHVLGLVHGIWTPIPRSVKDYIATPKPNGYQSLHTTVIPFLYESMFRLEVQIRTEEMDLIAERGIAAHYSGREFITGLVGSALPNSKSARGKTVCLNNANIALRIGWLNAIREWQEEFVGNMSSREFVDTITRDLLGSRVFVFTPRGEIKNLPQGATVIDYAYMIHTEIGNKMVAAKVNGNLVSPARVLANAEVVEIITYNALSSKSAFQRHKQWLQHAKTRSARHKIMKFLREQAARSASDITTEAVNDFVTDSEGESESEELSQGSNGCRPTWGKMFVNGVEITTPERNRVLPQSKNGSVWSPKVNGKHNKHVHHVSLNGKEQMLHEGNNLAKIIQATVPRYKEVLPGLESWQAQKIATWHNIEGHSIQWLCVVCIDRRGMMAEVTTALATAGITICSCMAEIDGGRGMGVMLFHIEGNLENLVSACSMVDHVLGVLGWSTGCSWPSLVEDNAVLEC
ncbi:hypothetical protein HN873_017781 [Arachis hypogaea]